MIRKMRGFTLAMLLLAVGACTDDARTVYPAEVLAVDTSTTPGENIFYIIEVDPANASTIIPRDTDIYIRFNRPVLNLLSVTSNITITDNVTLLPVAYGAALSGSSNEAVVLNPGVTLTASRSYTITFNSGLQDADSRNLDIASSAITYSSATAGYTIFTTATF